MFKKTLLVLSMLTSIYVQAAEMQRCLLTHMPLDFHTLIAGFLDFDFCETQEEFITRTSDAGDFSLSAEQLVLYRTPFRAGMHFTGESIACCPDKTKVILCENLHGSDVTPKVTVVHRDKKQILHTEAIYTDGYAPALSRNAHLFAVLCNTLKGCILTVKNVRTKNTQEFLVPPSGYRLQDHWSCFDKQTTRIILHYKDHLPTSTGRYTIFPLVSAEEIVQKEQKTLCHYFKSKLICKELVNSVNM